MTKDKLNQVRQKIVCDVDEYLARAKEVSMYIYNNPETGNVEYKAAKILCEELENNGFDVQQGLVGALRPDNEEVILDTAFKATLRGNVDGPNIAILLEYDALPMGHACGHNLICTAGLSAAVALSKNIESLGGNIIVFGTPAEEGALPGKGNKKEMVRAGNFDDIDIALANHPGDRWDTGANWLAFSKVTIDFYGVSSHAAAAPEKGVNALKAAYLFFNGVDALREHVRSDSFIHGIITHGGDAVNIVPEHAQISCTARAFDKPYVSKLVKRLNDIIQGACLMTGATAKYEWGPIVNAPINVPALVELAEKNVKSLDIDQSLLKKWTTYGSTDLGEVGVTIPTLNVFYPAAPDGTGLHTQEMLEAVKTDQALDSMIDTGKALALTACDLFADSALLSKVSREFSEIKNRLSDNEQT